MGLGLVKCLDSSYFHNGTDAVARGGFVMLPRKARYGSSESGDTIILADD